MATVPTATRAAVSRALARSRIGRASVCAVLLHAGQVGVPGRGRVSGALRACAASTSASTGSAAMTVCHFGHSLLPTRIATGLPRVRPCRSAAEDLDLVLLEAHPGAPAVAEPAAGQLAAIVGARQLDPGGHALQDRDERRAVRLTCGQPAQHAGKSVTRTALTQPPRRHRRRRSAARIAATGAAPVNSSNWRTAWASSRSSPDTIAAARRARRRRPAAVGHGS